MMGAGKWLKYNVLAFARIHFTQQTVSKKNSSCSICYCYEYELQFQKTMPQTLPVPFVEVPAGAVKIYAQNCLQAPAE